MSVRDQTDRYNERRDVSVSSSCTANPVPAGARRIEEVIGESRAERETESRWEADTDYASIHQISSFPSGLPLELSRAVSIANS
jgi:hypothetical protein